MFQHPAVGPESTEVHSHGSYHSRAHSGSPSGPSILSSLATALRPVGVLALQPVGEPVGEELRSPGRSGLLGALPSCSGHPIAALGI